MLDTGLTLRWKRHSLPHAAALPKGLLETVLVAEDHEVLRTRICRVLQESGCTALPAANADAFNVAEELMYRLEERQSGDDQERETHIRQVIRPRQHVDDQDDRMLIEPFRGHQTDAANS